MLKKKSDAKSFNKAINKYGLDAPHFGNRTCCRHSDVLGSRGTNTPKNGQHYSRRQRNPESGVIEHFVLETQP
jgi:hypothetical protein